MIDKEKVYGEYLNAQRKRRRLALSAAHKALDIPEDDEVNIINGFGWKELLVVAALICGSLLGWAWLQRGLSPPQQRHTTPVDSEYEVRFYDREGNPIEIPQIKRRN